MKFIHHQNNKEFSKYFKQHMSYFKRHSFCIKIQEAYTADHKIFKMDNHDLSAEELHIFSPQRLSMLKYPKCLKGIKSKLINSYKYDTNSNKLKYFKQLFGFNQNDLRFALFLVSPRKAYEIVNSCRNKDIGKNRIKSSKCADKTRNDTLIMLGNGFDRNCNLDSTFDNFLNACIKPWDNYEYFHGTYSKSSDNEKEAKKDQKGIHIDISNMQDQLKYLEDGVHYKINKSTGLTITNNSQMFDWISSEYDKAHNPNYLNFWIYYLYLLKGKNIPLTHIMWYDIEHQISYLCNNLYTFRHKYFENLFLDVNQNPVNIIHIFALFFNKQTRNNKIKLYYSNKYIQQVPQYFLDQFLFQLPANDTKYVNRPLDITLLISFEYCGFMQYLQINNKNHNNNYYQMFFNFLFNQLERFEKEFAQYLKVNMSKNEKQYYRKRLNGLNKICNNPYNLLTFNYTGRPNDNNCIAYLPIHSDINHCPIIGINDNECQDANGNDKNFDIFSKECQIVAYNLSKKTLIDIIPRNIKYIKIYGHSLSDDDFPYFKKIFDYCHLKDNKITIIFYYTNYDNDSDHRIKFTQKVFKFMDKYSINVRKGLWDHHHLEIQEINW